jgi:hypothetical protein
MNLSKRRISEMAYSIEEKITKNAIGKQDHYIASFGGFKHIQYKKNRIKVSPINLEKKNTKYLLNSLILIWTNNYRKADKILQNLKKNKKKNYNNLKLMNKFTRNFLFEIKKKKKNIKKIGEMISETWIIKKKLSRLTTNNNIQQIQENKKIGINNFQKKNRDKLKQLEKENIKLKANVIKSQVKSKAELAKNVLTNPANLTAIYPALGLLITNAFLNFITQRKQLEKQVNAVNFYIDTQVIDEASVIIATNLKNNTIKAINDAINKLKAIEGILKTINTALKIASTALRILGILLALLPAVPGAVLRVFEILNKIINGLSSIISPCVRILSNEIQKLKELIEKLKQIVLKLNNKTLAILTDEQLLKLIQTILPVGDVSLFQTLSAVPVSGSAGFVNIGGRIVPLNSTSAAGSLSPTSTTGVTDVGTIGTGTTVTAGTGSVISPTGVGNNGGITGSGLNTNNIAGGGAGTTGIGTTGTGITGAGATGIGTVGSGGTTAGTGSGIGNVNNTTNPSTITTPNTVNTSNTGTTNGTGTGLTTTGGTGNGGTNIGPVGIISNNATSSITPVVGSNNGLDNGLSNIPLGDQNVFPINLDQLALEGLDEAGLNELEQLTLEILNQEDPSLSQQQQSELKQVPSINDQANLYKGFRFQIKEEQDPRFTVRGTIKRRYAVAINRQGIEVIKSEYSFTLDPNDLVDQLKLVIDRQKLQG